MRLRIIKDTRENGDRILEVVENYVKENMVEIVDPVEIQKKMETIMEKKNALLAELDTWIKVSNATTFIEI